MKSRNLPRYINLVRNIDNWWLYLAQKAGLLRRDPLVFRARGGASVEVPRQCLVEFKEIFMDSCYTRMFDLEGTHDRPVIMDIGANAGFFTAYCAARYPDARIFAYEPVPYNFRLLTRNAGINPGRSITPLNVAVSGACGMLALSLESADGYTSTASVNANEKRHNVEIEVRCISLADAFAQGGFDRCDFLKLDCEGAEFGILYGASAEVLSRVRHMGIEVHPSGAKGHDMASLARFLEGHGFRVQSHLDILWAVNATA